MGAKDNNFFQEGLENIVTDWNLYYHHPYRTATYSRRITLRLLVKLISRYSPSESLVIAELGGANSCFLDGIQKTINPVQYHVIDNNQLGLDLLRERPDIGKTVFLHLLDIMDLELHEKLAVDVVFSVGLIEHFPPKDLIEVIQSHFVILKPGGIAIITYPTPTFLYRAARRISEGLGLWIFHDEIPLKVNDVLSTVKPIGKLLYSGINWPIVFTQGVIVLEKPADPYI